MNRRELLTKIMGAVAAPPVLACAKAEPEPETDVIHTVNPTDTPFATMAREAAERGKPVRYARVYQSDFGEVELTKPWKDRDRAAQGAPEAPREVCPVCRADQTGKAWYAGVQNVGGYCQAVCWDCRERVVTHPSSKA